MLVTFYEIPCNQRNSISFSGGTIEILGSPIGNDGKQSFHAFLSLRNDKLTVIMNGLFMPAEELLKQDICK